MRAFVATTPMVVFPAKIFLFSPRAAITASSVPRKRRFSRSHAPARMLPVFGSSTSPRQFTAISAPTETGPARYAHAPTPPRIAKSLPRNFPTVAPVPAPTEPSAGRYSGSSAFSAARRPISRSGRRDQSPQSRSKSTAEQTIGTFVTPTSKPIPRRSRSSITPDAASSPNALPPASTTAWIRSTRLRGSRRSVSRVPGAPPRTSTPATAPSSQTTTVHPVAAVSSWACPTRRPGISKKDIDSMYRVPSSRTVRRRRRFGQTRPASPPDFRMPL